MKSEELLRMFTDYCRAHPGERFWQALANWSKYAISARVLGRPDAKDFDTFYLEGDWKKWPR